MQPGSGFRAVFFDIGETILDRTAEYQGWARFLGVPAHTFSAVFGAVIGRGGGVRDVLAVFRPDEAFTSLQARADASGLLPAAVEADLYPGARSTLAQLQAMGLFVGIVGNQRASIGPQLRALALPADLVAVSSEWGLAKPEPAFFAALVHEAGCAPGEVLYVGDQLDNDVVAPLRAGLSSVRVLTGPWGHIERDPDIEAGCLAVIASLSELPGVLRSGLGGEERPDDRGSGLGLADE
ncbi:MAG: HAD-superfamily hydrolase, subfamily variant 1 [Pseudonocardiales bacterium]|nr:HAD-superfamily hydrolase, subfamily variant 1 [Pseudonocardiales bacterium]